jgi:hypothetical protein
MNTPYNTGKIQIGKYYQKPTYVEIDDDMIKVQGWLIGESKEARMNRIAKRIYMTLVVFLILFMVFATSAKAGAIASMPNRAGGKIVLTDEVCKHKGKVYDSLKRAYNYSTEGYTTEGCFAIEDETVVVIWDDGTPNGRMRYPIENFTLIKRSKGTQI